ncbi:DUF3019 domain-containing protein [Pseudoalteromonas tunicata]|uniref:DUF3019 domain-containing protein n=1 Tax=Pseudoalteromonas tunicata D2 TaxID=87626 RepID=A4C516_9GAMM|nr:DUF3019 domain-containing protein [Pseudoalteromonas tunicata]ATC96878.1 hypothetical protein PTUN_b0500 [Pseudoalteromonas tunicata]EAR30648.1 hypothetical protein PTD2_03726 [Pseudoalteromonas tunicata D2]
MSFNCSQTVLQLTPTHVMMVLLCLLPLVSTHTQANMAEKVSNLHVTPNRCVALRQGQTCFQDITFKWQQAEVANYCLIELSTSQPLKCWQHATRGEYSIDFKSEKSLTYVLRKDKESTNLASSTVTVSWVYKSSKRPKSSWKLF